VTKPPSDSAISRFSRTPKWRQSGDGKTPAGHRLRRIGPTLYGWAPVRAGQGARRREAVTGFPGVPFAHRTRDRSPARSPPFSPALRAFTENKCSCDDGRRGKFCAPALRFISHIFPRGSPRPRPLSPRKRPSPPRHLRQGCIRKLGTSRGPYRQRPHRHHPGDARKTFAGLNPPGLNPMPSRSEPK